MVQKLRLGLDSTAHQGNSNEDFNLYGLYEFNSFKSILSLSLIITGYYCSYKLEHLIPKTYQFWLVSGVKVTNFIFKAIKVGNSENADR